MIGKQLPGAESAIVEERKILEYLLNLNHEEGRGKAQFFMSFGFTREDWGALRDALQRHAVHHLVSKNAGTPYGVNCCVDCSVETPDRRNPCIRTVWELKSEAAPRLITAHPR